MKYSPSITRQLLKQPFSQLVKLYLFTVATFCWYLLPLSVYCDTRTASFHHGNWFQTKFIFHINWSHLNVPPQIRNLGFSLRLSNSLFTCTLHLVQTPQYQTGYQRRLVVLNGSACQTGVQRRICTWKGGFWYDDMYRYTICLKSRVAGHYLSVLTPAAHDAITHCSTLASFLDSIAGRGRCL